MTSTSASNDTTSITIDVSHYHPHIQLLHSIDWFATERALAHHWRLAGKNVDRLPGRPFDLSFWTRVIVLMLLLKLDSRQMERELKYNVVSRLFVTTPRPTEGFVRDHANIDRTYRALGVDGIEELNRLIIQKALDSGFSNLDTLSSDATIQEVNIGYPNEPGILRQVATRVVRLGKRLLKAGIHKTKVTFEGANGSINRNFEDGVLQIQQAKTTECGNGRTGGPTGHCIQKV